MWVFRALFLLYAESAGHLPMSNHTYAGRSFTRIAERAAEELDVADQNAKTLWGDVSALVEAMRTGQSAWGVPAYNGALFAPDGFDGAADPGGGLDPRRRFGSSARRARSRPRRLRHGDRLLGP